MVFANVMPVFSAGSSLNSLPSLPSVPQPVRYNSAIRSAERSRQCMLASLDVFFGMSQKLPISRVINLIPAASQRLWTTDESEGRRRLLASDMGQVLNIEGSFALVAQDGERVVLARSLDR